MKRARIIPVACSVGSLVGACSGGVSPAPPAARPVASASAPSTPAEPVERPLNAVEKSFVPELKRDVQALAGRIGERSAANPWGMAEAADYIVGELATAGYSVRRQGFEIDYTALQNLEVTLPGTRRGDQIVVFGAHYDSAKGSPGADDNASGVAALLAMARELSGERFLRTLRLVFFAAEEPPYYRSENMGSLVYAKSAAAAGEQITGMVSIESVGYFSTEKGSQRYPAGVPKGLPTTGDFIAIVGKKEDARHVGHVASSFSSYATISAQAAALPASLDGVGWSDQWSFWEVGYPGVMVTDTALMRNPHYHQPSDTPDTLDYESMARVTYGLVGLARDMAGAPRAVPEVGGEVPGFGESK